MNDIISLCITYVYHGYEPKPSLYRIADYYDGKYVPVDIYSFSDSTESFNPRFLRVRPGDESTLYSPVIKRWNSVPRIDDSEKSTTESFSHNGIAFYEIVIDESCVSADSREVQKSLEKGFALPEGASNNLLLVIDQDDLNYYAILCRKSALKQDAAGKYFFPTNMSDLVHTIHFLDQYVIPKDDVFDTSQFTLYTSQNTAAPKRMFYRYDSLPDPDGPFYLHDFRDYIPTFVARYLKTEGNNYGFSKNEIQRISDVIKDSISSSQMLESFFAQAGYSYDDVIQRLPDCQEQIVNILLSKDEVNNIIRNALFESEDAQELFLEEAKAEWFKTNSEDKKAAERELLSIRQDIDGSAAESSKAQKKNEELRQEALRIQTVIDDLKGIQDALQTSIDATIDSFETTVGEKLSEYAILRKLSGIETKTPNTQNAGGSIGFSFSQEEKIESEETKSTDDSKKACALLTANLCRVGMNSYYASIIGKIVSSRPGQIHSFIISSMFSSAFANALSCSIFASSPFNIRVQSATICYENLKQLIEKSDRKVVLIDGLLDYCNENVFYLLNQDFKNTLFIFSVNSEETFSILSKNIWGWSYYVNSDLSFEGMMAGEHQLIPAEIHCFEASELKYSLEGYENVCAKLKKLGFPIQAQRNYISLLRFLADGDMSCNPDDYLNSVIAKITSVNAAVLSEDDIEMIIEGMPEAIKQMYF